MVSSTILLGRMGPQQPNINKRQPQSWYVRGPGGHVHGKYEWEYSPGQPVHKNRVYKNVEAQIS